MCGRFTAGWSDDDLAQSVAAAWVTEPLPGPNLNVCPTQQVRVVTQHHKNGPQQHNGLAAAQWAFVPQWAKTPPKRPLINARAETLFEKPSFVRSATTHRVLVPAQGWFEWSNRGGTKQPWLLEPRDEELLAFAAVCSVPHHAAEQLALFAAPPTPTVAIVTVEAQGAVAQIHHRAPLVIRRADWAQWLDPHLTDTDTVRGLITAQPPADVTIRGQGPS